MPQQEFMEGAGDNGVLLVAMGTVATLGEHPYRLIDSCPGFHGFMTHSHRCQQE